MLEAAVGNANVLSRTPHPHAARMHGRTQSPWGCVVIPGRRGNIPRGSGESKSQTGDVEMLDLLAVHQVHLPASLDLPEVRISLARHPQIQPAAISFFL